MIMHDDDFLRALTERADRAIPSVPVHTEHVIPRARRRRRLIRTGQTVGVLAVLGVIAGGVGWAWQDRPNPIAPQPTVSPTPSPTPESTPSPTSTPDPTPDPSDTAPPVTTSPPVTTDALPYWYCKTVTNSPQMVEVYGAYSEQWVGIGLTGLTMIDGDPARAYGIDVDAAFYEQPWSGGILRLPQSAQTLPRDVSGLRSLLVQVVGESDTPEASVAIWAWNILETGGLVPGETRLAAVQLLRESPVVTITPGADDTGRPGLVAVLDVEGQVFRLVIDPDTALLLQVDGMDGIDSVLYYQEAVAALPFPPSSDLG